jgi:type I restriction enzyme S subunit
MMKTYPEMKESGLDWISVIPSHWETQKLKFLVSIKKDISGKVGPDVLSVTQKGIRIKDTTTGGGQLSMDYSKYQLVQTGDFVMNHMDLLTGFVDISNFEGVTSPDYRVFHITSSIQDPNYLLRNLQLCYWLKIFYGLGQGVSNLGRWRLPTEVFENFRLPLPSLPEQQQIVSFLDEKTSLINKIIEYKTQRIELLKEMRSSLISEVVTKGLNPDVPMKDSGVEWIGEIPSHWKTERIQSLTSVDNSGIWGEDDPFLGSIEVRIPTTKNLTREGRWIQDEMTLRHVSVEEWEHYKCERGDIVVVKSSGSADNIVSGKCGVIGEGEHERFSFGNFLMRLRPTTVIPKFLYYFLKSDLTRQRIERMVSTTTYPNLKVDEYVKVRMTYPPLPEQEKIVSFLDEKSSLIDQEIGREENSIKYLKEFRQSITHEVVTGKMDVRGVVTS